MIVEYVRYRMTQHTPAELIAAYGIAGEHLRAAPECVGSELTACEEEPSLLILRILWTSTRDHVEGFRKGPHFPPFLKAIRPFFGEIEEMRHYAATGVSWSR